VDDLVKKAGGEAAGGKVAYKAWVDTVYAS
jgi:hypothetical protein